MNLKHLLLIVPVVIVSCAEPPASPKPTATVVEKDSIAPVRQDTISQESGGGQDDIAKQEEAKGKPATAPKGGAGQKKLDAMVIPENRHDEGNFKVITDLDPTIQLDIRYATTNNFTKAKIYDCPECLLRPEAAKALIRVHQDLKLKGYGGLKMFDCYRPRPYQQRLWDKVPNPDYVTPPAKGSMHSRGAAVDLTIVDKNGKELEMGTPYDFFGVQAHYDYKQLPAAVLANRRLLRTSMEAAGFEGIRTEWWHFSYRKGNYDLSDYLWKCK